MRPEVHSMVRWVSPHLAHVGESSLQSGAMCPYFWQRLHVPGVLMSLCRRNYDPMCDILPEPRMGVFAVSALLQ